MNIGLILHKWLKVPYVLNVQNKRIVHTKAPTVLFIHGIGSTGKMWQSVIDTLPANTNFVAVDLLGFGKSPNPYWESYDAKLQSRSLLTTYLRLRLRGPIIIVGHSLGALVAVEFAKQYPRYAISLLLCSPPIYRQDNVSAKISPEKILIELYERLLQKPKLLIKLYGFGRDTKIDPSLVVNDENIEMFISSARASVLNQTTTEDITNLTLPIHIINGIFDPLVIRSNLSQLTKNNDNVSLEDIPVSHPIKGLYVRRVAAVIQDQLERVNTSKEKLFRA